MPDDSTQTTTSQPTNPGGLPKTNPDMSDTTQQASPPQGPSDAQSTDENLSVDTSSPPSTDVGADSVIKSSQVPKKYGGKKIIATIFGIFLLIGGVAAGVFLVQRQQQIAERAASGKECEHSPDCVLLDNPGNSGSSSFGRIITHIFITAKDYHRYDPGETNDGCYHVIIHEYNLQWNRVGSGPDCKDVSNVQVWLGSEKPPELDWSIKQVCDGIEVGVSNKHDGFTAKVEFSPSASPGTWQGMQSWQTSAGSGKTHSFNYDPIPTAGWWVKASVMYKNNQVAVIEEPILDCSEPTSTPTATPTDTPLSAQCDDIKIYDANWNLLSSSDLEALTPGVTIKLAVSGSTNLGFFDKARFIINGTTTPETSNTKPGTDEFYHEYSIPESVDNFTIDAELHHSTLGWF